MKILQKIMLIILLTAGATMAVEGKSWESVRADMVAESRVVAQTEEIEVRTQSGVIIVTTNRAIEIKVFTILGQLVSQEKLSPGTSRLNIGSHGVYIVKVGELTCKVAL